VTDKPPGDGAPPQKSLADVLDDLLLQEELEELRATDPADAAKELAELGFDAERTKARVLAAREAVYAPKPAPQGEVVNLAAARAKRKLVAHPYAMAAAAALALVAGGSGVQFGSTYRPPTTVSYPVRTEGYTPQQVAAAEASRALRLCALGYFGECQDALDDARATYPGIETNELVALARQQIADDQGRVHERPRDERYAKPGVGPHERPLQPMERPLQRKP
jgi:hypothetical protein